MTRGTKKAAIFLRSFIIDMSSLTTRMFFYQKSAQVVVHRWVRPKEKILPTPAVDFHRKTFFQLKLKFHSCVAGFFHMILRYLRLYLGLYLGWGVETLQGRAVSQVKVTGSLEEVELVTDLLQQKYELKRSDCEFEAGIHLIKLKKIQRQFAFVVPRGYVNESPSGVPVFMWFHGLYQTPWFSINALGLPDMLERYGWFGILPFGTEALKNSSMGGPLQCCSEFCESEKCCLNSKEITSKEHPNETGDER